MRKENHLRIRITENQFKVLAERVIEEQRTKSEIIREMIDNYVKNCRTTIKSDVIQVNRKIRDLNNNNPKIKF